MLTPSSLQPGFLVVHSNRLEQLRELVVAWTKRYPLSPLEPEQILVQSNGIAQWLKLALAADETAGGCGIAASLDVQLPARFIWDLYQQVLGSERVPEQSPYSRELLTWHLLELLPALPVSEIFLPLQQFIKQDKDLQKTWQLAQKLAALYDQYQVYRADWLQSWQQGQNILTGNRGNVQPLPVSQEWQAELWRLLQNKINQQAAHNSRAEVHQQFLTSVTALPAEYLKSILPRRVIIFGISALPQQSLEVLAAIAPYSQILLAVHNPCRYYWADIIADKDLLRAARRRQQQKPGMPAELPEDQLVQHAHPLLAAWGRQGRDYIRLLDEFDETLNYRNLFQNNKIDLFDEEPAASLLQMLQQDILELRPLHESRQYWPVTDTGQDTSVQFHIAHSPLREVEILHDQLLAAFDSDPELKPRDIMVMVPDINRYAPYIQAVFGALKTTDTRYIPFTLADLGVRHQQPLLKALDTLLALPHSRFSVSDILDLLDVPPLRQRFGLTAEQLPLLQRWIAGAGVRWGLDAEQRATLELPENFSINSWAFGLDRMFLGYAAGESEAWQQIEPYAEVGGLDAELLGPLQLFIERLKHYWQQLQQTYTATEWQSLLQQLLADFFEVSEPYDLQVMQQLQQSLAEWLSECRQAELALPLSRQIVTESWLTKLEQPGLQQRFLAGAVNFATLLPMRAIPFKQICLLGMNDGAFPRQQSAADFDLMQHDIRPGDRSRREDDRYLLLEAVLSARKTLYVSWTGRSIHDNSQRAPSMLIGQLRDHLDNGWQAMDNGKRLSEQLTTEHPLQPFSQSYFNGQHRHLFSYQSEWLQFHQADNQSINQALSPYQPEQAVTIRKLTDFLKDPVKAFYQQRLKIWLQTPQQQTDNEEVFALDALSNWQLQDELIQQLQQAVEQQQPAEPAIARQLQRFQLRGELGIGAAAELQKAALAEPLLPLADDYQQVVQQWPQASDACPVSFNADTIQLQDVLTGIRSNQAGSAQVLLLSHTLQKDRKQYQWRHFTGPWIQHLVANACIRPMPTVMLSKSGRQVLAPLASEVAAGQLSTLLQLYLTGLSRLLPVELNCAMLYLAAQEKAGAPLQPDELDICRKRYEGDGFSAGALAYSPYLARSFSNFSQLWQQGDFARYSEQLYLPLYQAVLQSGVADD
ncbi:exodeoxyribonuclease V subunit gamma [Chromatiaceae bacterium AAb-1]|nr:exodeoxyribonuclease V subunit gamma [Chromatiaceae bacterium AAb-1]